MPPLEPDRVRELLLDWCRADREDAEDAAAAIEGAPADLLEQRYRTIAEDMGGRKWLQWPQPPPAHPLLGLYPVLAAVPLMLEYHRERGVGEDLSRLVMEDVGEKLRLNRRMYGRAGLDTDGWFTAHVRGTIYQLGRLQFCIEGAETRPVIGLHIRGEGGPLSFEAVRDSVERALGFFPAAFPELFGDRDAITFTCTSWLLDPQLRDWLPERSNILKFASLFDLVGPESHPGTNGHDDVRRFVFARTPRTPDSELPADNTLQRSILAGIKAGVEWRVPLGGLALARLGLPLGSRACGSSSPDRADTSAPRCGGSWPGTTSCAWCATGPARTTRSDGTPTAARSTPPSWTASTSW